MKILLTGGKGQFGITFKYLIPNNIEGSPIRLFAPSRRELNIIDEKLCYSYIKKIKPDWVINAAAFTNVDEAEILPDKANLVNGMAPYFLSKAIDKVGGKLIQISTDFVFDGKKLSPYNTFDQRNPINTYGKTKEKGELAVEEILHPKGKGLILRTSWLMSPFRNNFLLTILKLLNSKNQIQVVHDQIGCPTSTFTLAKLVWTIIQKNNHKDSIVPYLHCCDDGITNWYEVALYISTLANELGIIRNNPEIIPIKSSEYKALAKRPYFSLLNNNLIKKEFIYDSKDWQVTIREILNKILQS